MPRIRVSDILIALFAAGLFEIGFAAFNVAEGDETYGFSLAFILWILLSVLSIPLVSVMRGKLAWIHPINVVSVYGLMGFGVPCLYHLFNREMLRSRSLADYFIQNTPASEYLVLMVHIIIAFLATYSVVFLSRRDVTVPTSEAPVKEYRFSALLGLAMLLVGLWGIYMLYDGVAGYVERFSTMGVRLPPPIGKGRYSRLGELTMLGSILLFLGLRGLRGGVGMKRHWFILSICILLGGVKLYNTGARSQLAGYILLWMIVVHVGVQEIPWKRILLVGVVTLALLVIVGVVRKATSSLESELTYDQIFSRNAEYITKAFGLEVDKVSMTLLSFRGIAEEGGHLWGETYIGNLIIFLSRPLEVLGYPLPESSYWSISNFHGYWYIGNPNYTGLPSSMIGEDYANFGILGVLMGGLLLGGLVVVNCKVMPKVKSPIRVLIWALWTATIIRTVLYGGWATLIPRFCYTVAPLYLMLPFLKWLGLVGPNRPDDATIGREPIQGDG